MIRRGSDEEAQLGAKLEAAKTCVHCKHPRSTHLLLKCLFDTTEFAPMTLEQWTAYQLEQRTRGLFPTQELPGMAIANMRAIQKLEMVSENYSVNIVVTDEEPKK